MTRILFDTSSLDSGPSGSKTRLETLVPALEARGHQVTLAIVPGRSGVFRRWLNPRALERAARRSRAEVALFETWPAPRLDVPMIAVVHDLRHVRAGGLRRTIALRFLRDAARRVRRFHAVSETTRQELAALLPEAEDRIDVVPNAVVVPSGTADPSVLPEGLDEAPFVFAAGHSEPRKRWPFVAAVAADLAASGIRVIRAGRGGQHHQKVFDLGIVSDEERDELFRRAVAVLAPSGLEGFGLVPLEALACGAWVVASSIPAHREVLGDAADFFEPGDRAAAVAKITAASHASESERASRAERARARARLYSPQRAADAFEASLRAAL